MRRGYRIVDDLLPTTPGGGVSIQSSTRPFIVKVIDDSWLGQNLNLLNDEAIEGVDTPFFTNQDFFAFPHGAAAKRREIRLAFRRRTDEDFGVPRPIGDVPPDVSGLTFGLGLDPEGRPRAWLAREKKRLLHRLTILPQDGLTAPFIPATSFQANSCEMFSEIQRHLLEATIDGGLTWTFWTVEEVLKYTNERISKFLLETGMLQTITTIPTIPGEPFYDLPGDLVELTRLDVGNVLSLTTKWEMDHSDPGWQMAATGTPERYMLWPEDSLTVRLFPVPNAVLSMRVIYIANVPPVTSVCAPLPIPAVFAPYIKYGVMADMLSKQGEANDPQRADYCEQRFQEGVELAAAMMGVLSSEQ